MATYLYGLALAGDAQRVPAHIAGLGGETLRVLECGGVAALVSTLRRKPARATLDAVRAHDHALQAVVHHGATVVASRFGQTYASDEECRQRTNDASARVERLLTEFGGCVEMRVLLPGAEIVRAARAQQEDLGPGHAYLERLRGKHLSSVALRDAIGPCVRAERVEELAKGRGVAFAHLIHRDDERDYRSAIAALPALASAHVIGPLPIYSFAEWTN